MLVVVVRITNEIFLAVRASNKSKRREPSETIGFYPSPICSLGPIDADHGMGKDA